MKLCKLCAAFFLLKSSDSSVMQVVDIDARNFRTMGSRYHIKVGNVHNLWATMELRYG